MRRFAHSVFAVAAVATCFTPALAEVLYRTTDGGKTWEQATLPTEGRVRQLVCDPIDPAVALVIQAGTPPRQGHGPFMPTLVTNGIYRTGDGGKTWTELYDRDATFVAIDSKDPQVLWAADLEGLIRWTPEAGEWKRVSLGRLMTFRRGPVEDLTNWPRAVVARGSKVLVLAHRGYYGYALLSSDAGKTWRRISGEAAVNGAFVGHHVLLVTECGAFLRSADDGQTWTTLRENEPRRPGGHGSFATSHDGKEIVFLFRGFMKSSRDGGAIWMDVEPGAKDACPSSVAWSGGRMLAVFTHGEYREIQEGGRTFIEGIARGGEERERKTSLHVRQADGVWEALAGPAGSVPVSVHGAGDGTAVWLVVR